jgi:CheY-like chemotaxis protein
MDLAMPGIDGWETIRRLRALGGIAQVKVAIVSANAFDKGLENDVGIGVDDFIVKPVRHAELLDWLERRLTLSWVEAAPAQAKTPMPSSPEAGQAHEEFAVLPERQQLQALRELATLGYFRGIMNLLTEILQAQPECAGFVSQMQVLARQYEFEKMGRQLDGLCVVRAPETTLTDASLKAFIP